MLVLFSAEDACYSQITCGDDLSLGSATECKNCMDCDDPNSCEMCWAGTESEWAPFFETCNYDEEDSYYYTYSCNGTYPGRPVEIFYSDAGCSSLPMESYHTCECNDDDGEDDDDEDDEDCANPSETYSTWSCETKSELDGTAYDTFTVKNECGPTCGDDCMYEQELSFAFLETYGWTGDWDCFSTGNDDLYMMSFECVDSTVKQTAYTDSYCTNAVHSSNIACNEECDDDDKRRLEVNEPGKVKSLHFEAKTTAKNAGFEVKKMVKDTKHKFKIPTVQLPDTKKKFKMATIRLP